MFWRNREEWEKETLFIGHDILNTWARYNNVSSTRGRKREQVDIRTILDGK